MYKHWKLLILAILSLLLVSGTTAAAEDIGLWGGWNDGGHRWRESESYLNRESQNGSTREDEAFPRIMDGGGRPWIEPVAPRIVYFPSKESTGTILIDTEGRRLYYVLNSDEAYDYPISVGREGFTWTGTETISRVAEWPDWHPPKEMLERDAKLPELMYGGIKNPLGAVALFLGNSLYRIHGTNDPKTIGYAASSGCFRMMNEHALHLATLAKVGTTVKVLPRVETRDAVAELPWLNKPTALGGFGSARSARTQQTQGWEPQVVYCARGFRCGSGE